MEATQPDTVEPAIHTPSLSVKDLYNLTRQFVKKYYETLHNSPQLLFKFYDKNAYLCHLECEDHVTKYYHGIAKIKAVLASNDFKNCRIIIDRIDHQPLMDAVLVCVHGFMFVNCPKPGRRFAQTFVLRQNTKNYYCVQNDILRYLPYTYEGDQAQPPTEHPSSMQGGRFNNPADPLNYDKLVNQYKNQMEYYNQNVHQLQRSHPANEAPPSNVQEKLSSSGPLQPPGLGSPRQLQVQNGPPTSNLSSNSQHPQQLHPHEHFDQQPKRSAPPNRSSSESPNQPLQGIPAPTPPPPPQNQPADHADNRTSWAKVCSDPQQMNQNGPNRPNVPNNVSKENQAPPPFIQNDKQNNSNYNNRNSDRGNRNNNWDHRKDHFNDRKRRGNARDRDRDHHNRDRRGDYRDDHHNRGRDQQRHDHRQNNRRYDRKDPGRNQNQNFNDYPRSPDGDLSLYLKSIPQSMSEEDVSKAFAQFGEVTKFMFIGQTNRKQGSKRGILSFNAEEAVNKALESAQGNDGGVSINGKVVVVERHRAPNRDSDMRRNNFHNNNNQRRQNYNNNRHGARRQNRDNRRRNDGRNYNRDRGDRGDRGDRDRHDGGGQRGDRNSDRSKDRHDNQYRHDQNDNRRNDRNYRNDFRDNRNDRGDRDSRDSRSDHRNGNNERGDSRNDRGDSRNDQRSDQDGGFQRKSDRSMSRKSERNNDRQNNMNVEPRNVRPNNNEPRNQQQHNEPRKKDHVDTRAENQNFNPPRNNEPQLTSNQRSAKGMELQK